MWHKAANTALNLLLPPRCISCGTMVGEVAALCPDCWSGIDFITDPLCNICGHPLETGASKNSLCGNCLLEMPPYDSGRAVFCYNDKSKSLILDFKYSDRLHLAKRFAEWILQTARPMVESADVIIPVPLHWRRLFERRYNQSAIITNALSSLTGIRSEPMAMVRKKYTPPQVSLTRKQRLTNVAGAFTINPKYAHVIEDKNVLLIDDVMTTGATLYECSKILKKADAKKVIVVTLGRTVEGR